MNNLKVPKSIAEKLGYYVYVYVNPIDDVVFYVGKGKGSRALAHLRKSDRDVHKVIREIRAAGLEPRIDILAHSLPDAKTALKIEAAAIDLLGINNLTNSVRGHGVQYGRMPINELTAHYERRKASITEPSILIRINRLYRYGMTPAELYDATRSAWVVGAKREEVDLAFAIYDGVVREVYSITTWLPAGSTFNYRYGGRSCDRGSRWEFVGVLAEERLREMYRNRYVGHFFPPGAQNPVSYVNVK